MRHSVYLYIFLMAFVTYLIRALPLTIFRREIRSPFLLAFLRYVPYACLAAMTFPAMLTAPGSVVCGAAAFVTALVAAYFGRSLLTVALLSSLAALCAELLQHVL